MGLVARVYTRLGSKLHQDLRIKPLAKSGGQHRVALVTPKGKVVIKLGATEKEVQKLVAGFHLTPKPPAPSTTKHFVGREGRDLNY